MTQRKKTAQQGLMLMELLVALTIASIVSAMIVMSWFALQDSYGSTTKRAQSEDIAREAVARMTRELRDMQGNAGQAAVVSAQPNSIEFYTPFNDLGGKNLYTKYAYVPMAKGGKLVRYRDVNQNGAWEPGERETVIASDVVNGLLGVPVFTYTYVDPYEDPANPGQTFTAHQIPDVNTARLLSVQMHVMIDLNPGHAPSYLDLKTTAQPRNLRLL
jgi:type II secretory pathway pseudopilin PulG